MQLHVEELINSVPLLVTLTGLSEVAAVWNDGKHFISGCQRSVRCVSPCMVLLQTSLSGPLVANYTLCPSKHRRTCRVLSNFLFVGWFQGWFGPDILWSSSQRTGTCLRSTSLSAALVPPSFTGSGSEWRLFFDQIAYVSITKGFMLLSSVLHVQCVERASLNIRVQSVSLSIPSFTLQSPVVQSLAEWLYNWGHFSYHAIWGIYLSIYISMTNIWKINMKH